MGKCKQCGKQWHLIKMDDEHTFCLGCGSTRPSEEFFYNGDELLSEFDGLTDSMTPGESAAIIDKYYDF